MGCLTVSIKKLKQACNIIVDTINNCIVNITSLHDMSIEVSDTVSPLRIYVKPSCHIKINTSHSKILKVSAGLVCTINDVDENEMWWCDYWRVLWNNGVKALWVR